MTEPTPAPTEAQPAPTSATGADRTPAPQLALPPDLLAILNSAMLIMGPTKSGKSSLLATMAEFVWETYRKVSLYYLIDGGGFPPQVQALMNRGIIRLWRVRTRSGDGLAFETLQRVSQGWWPQRVDPRTGEAAANVALVPPVTSKYTLSCPNGHLVKTVPMQSFLQAPSTCPECKMQVTMMNGVVGRTQARTKGFEMVGAMLIDGISSACSWMMDDLSKRDLGGEKSRLGGTILSGDLIFGENNRAQVGFTQNRAEQLALNALSVPFLVVPPVWTALVAESNDEGGLSVKGPLLSGQAKTAVAPQWFGDTLEPVIIEANGKKFRRLMLQSWIDERGARHLCGVRSFPGMMPNYLEDEESDNPALAFQNFNLGAFYRMREDVAKRVAQNYDQRYPDAPGMVPIDMEYGEAAAVVAANATTQPVPGLAAAPRPGAAPMAPSPRGNTLPAGGAPSPAPSTSTAPAQAATPAPGTASATGTAPPPPAAQTAAQPPVGPPLKTPAAPAPRARSRVAGAVAAPGVVTAPGGAVPPAQPTPPSAAAAPPSVPSAVLNGPAMSPAPPPPPPSSGPVRAPSVPPPPGRRPS